MVEDDNVADGGHEDEHAELQHRSLFEFRPRDGVALRDEQQQQREQQRRGRLEALARKSPADRCVAMLSIDCVVGDQEDETKTFAQQRDDVQLVRVVQKVPRVQSSWWTK